MATQHVPRRLRVREAAQLTGLERWRLYELLKRGEGPRFMKVGRTIRISEAALVEWIAEQHNAPKSPAHCSARDAV